VYTRPNAPRSIGGVLDDGLRLWRQAFSRAWPLAIMAQVLVSIPIVIFWIQSGSVAGAQTQFFLVMTKSVGFALAYFLVSLASIGFQNAVIAQTDATATGVARTVGQSLTLGFRLLGRAFLMLLLIGLGVAVPVGLLFVVLAGVSVAGRIAIGLVAFLLFCFVFGKIILATIILVIEDTRATDSLRRSGTLTTGHWWRIATIFTVLIIVVAVVFLVVGVIAGIVGASLGPKSGISAAFVQLITLFGNTLITPLSAAVSVAIYYDLKLRKEGADLAGRVNALAPQ
jgi:hypothetical protein